MACAQYRIYDQRAKTLIQREGEVSKGKRGSTHVLFLIHLHKEAAGSFVGFRGDPWISLHIDELRPAGDSALTLQYAIGAPISSIFLTSGRERWEGMKPMSTTPEEQKRTMTPVRRTHGYCRWLSSCIQAAASRVQDSEENKERAIQRVAILVKLIPRDPLTLG